MNDTDRKTVIALGLIAVAAVPLIWLLKDVKGPQGPTTSQGQPTGSARPALAKGANGTSVQSLGSNVSAKAVSEPQKLAVEAEEASIPSLIVDVYEPAKAKAALKQNAWLQETMKQPLGEGFVGPWAGFWGTRGQDVAAHFEGEVLDFVADQMLSAPFRVVWFGGSDSTSTPVLVVPHPPGTSEAAFTALTQAAGHGVQIAERCPTDPRPTPAKTPDAGAVAEGTRKLEIQRWVLANQALYASQSEGKLVIARSPSAVLQGLCTTLEEPKRAPGADVELTLATPGLGHEAELLTSLLGVGDSPRLAFAIEENRLVPRGIAGEIEDDGRVDVAPLSDDLLKAIPVDMPVMLTAQLKLPQTLDAETLKTFFAGTKVAGGLTRQVAVVWVPHGDTRTPTDVAVLWSRQQDADGLKALFTGNNPVKQGRVCNQLVFASTEAMLQRLERACSGRTPSLANAAGPIVAGLRAPASIGLQLQLGQLLSGVTLESWKAEASTATNKNPAPPAEIQAAQQQLEQLPTFGLTGTAKGATLVAGGFHS